MTLPMYFNSARNLSKLLSKNKIFFQTHASIVFVDFFLGARVSAQRRALRQGIVGRHIGRHCRNGSVTHAHTTDTENGWIREMTTLVVSRRLK